MYTDNKVWLKLREIDILWHTDFLRQIYSERDR